MQSYDTKVKSQEKLLEDRGSSLKTGNFGRHRETLRDIARHRDIGKSAGQEIEKVGRSGGWEGRANIARHREDGTTIGRLPSNPRNHSTTTPLSICNGL